jgi:hypothetical protein
MIRVEDALQGLNIVGWTLSGKPKNESEFNAQFKKIIGTDGNGTAIVSSNPSEFGVTWSQVSTKQKELQTAYDNAKYQRDRAEAYPSIGEQLDLIYHAGQGGDAFQAAIKAVKDKHPKG